MRFVDALNASSKKLGYLKGDKLTIKVAPTVSGKDMLTSSDIKFDGKSIAIDVKWAQTINGDADPSLHASFNSVTNALTIEKKHLYYP
ncbi:hypothetical protein [Bacillus thuringiensis]|uniref:hypothetical protein n=1 Tax=Bacillus thuringiensis TaxID=1428 RepID=UPI0026E1EFD0|nr:hypothetical protein [Bacillus thuringiensis]